MSAARISRGEQRLRGLRPGAAVPRGASGAGFLGWMSRGACRQADPELFFPRSMAGTGVRQAEAAKTVCGGCEVRAKCLSYALETMPEGIWGGTTREERRAARRYSACRASAQSCGTVAAAVTGEPAARTGRLAGQPVTSGWTA
jgi:WhiB family transcriptional regulator, redox-sensing transcriptional regulator